MMVGEKTNKFKHKGMNFKRKPNGNKSFQNNQGGKEIKTWRKTKAKENVFTVVRWVYYEKGQICTRYVKCSHY